MLRRDLDEDVFRAARELVMEAGSPSRMRIRVALLRVMVLVSAVVILRQACRQRPLNLPGKGTPSRWQ